MTLSSSFEVNRASLSESMFGYEAGNYADGSSITVIVRKDPTKR